MNSLASQNGDLLSSVEAGRRYGYTNDYIARLAREKKIVGEQSGRQWFVEPASLEKFLEESTRAKKLFASKVRESRKKEREAYQNTTGLEHLAVRQEPRSTMRAVTLIQAGVVLIAGTLLGSVLYLGLPFLTTSSTQEASIFSVLEEFVGFIYSLGREPASTPTPLATTPKAGSGEGMIAYPSSAGLDGEKVQESFSDEVSITPDADGGGGVIRPNFRTGEGEEYRYLMVPIDTP